MVKDSGSLVPTEPPLTQKARTLFALEGAGHETKTRALESRMEHS